MPTIQPVSDLTNYNAVLQNVSVGNPVYLTKNGRVRYIISLDKDYERQQAVEQLLADLKEGVNSENVPWKQAKKKLTAKIKKVKSENPHH